MNPNQAIQLAIKMHWYCPHCGDTDTLQTHHRKNRGMGGTPKRSLDRFDNLLRVCAELNFLMESNPEMAKQAREYGWKLRQYESFAKPYFDIVAQKWFELSIDGGRRVL